jgi:hypothetical protein
LGRTVAKRKKRKSWSIQKKKKKKKDYWLAKAKKFFSSLPNLLPQKIRLPLISFFSGVSYI